MVIRSIGDALSGLGDFLLTPPLHYGSISSGEVVTSSSSTVVRHYVVTSSSATVVRHYEDDEPPSPWTRGRRGDRPPAVLRPNPCDADALAHCMSDGSENVVFVNLDEASLDSFQQFSEKEDTERLLLYYYPSLLDSYFQSNNMDSSTIQNRTIQIGRVNCHETPNLCGMFVHTPSLHLLIPEPKKSDIPQIPKGFQPLEYGTGVKECLWKRFGAEMVTSSCESEMKRHGERYKTGGPIAIEELQQYGARIARCNEILILFTCFLLVVALTLVGWKLLKRCLGRCCGVAMMSSSVSMTKEERKAQLQQQESCFFFAVIILGLTNVFFPAVIMCIAGPIALGAIVWLVYVEFKCASPCRHLWPRASNDSAPTEDNQVALLSDAA